jgi:hypothetical protein
MVVSRRTYFAIKESLTAKEKQMINYYDTMWHLRHQVPTTEQVANYVGLTHVTVNYYLHRRPVIKALEQRGIPWQQHSQEELTPTQVATAITMSNFADTRSNPEKLDQLGVNPTQYYAWLNDPAFKNMVENLAEQNLKNIKPTAIGELTKKINAGDWNAVKYYLDTTGAIRNNEGPPSEELIKMFVEIIQRHVKDPEVIMAIAADIKLASLNRTLEVVDQTPQIAGEIVSREEFEAAKKTLGIQ